MEEKESKFDRRYLEMAAVWAKNSYCERRQVGALLVKDRMIISDGYNGTPAGFEHTGHVFHRRLVHLLRAASRRGGRKTASDMDAHSRHRFGLHRLDSNPADSRRIRIPAD